jgi:hypothetical protein
MAQFAHIAGPFRSEQGTFRAGIQRVRFNACREFVEELIG